MKKRKAFTLIEVIVSIAIIGILSIAFLNIFDTGLRNVSRAGLRTENLLVVKNQVDDQIMDDTQGVLKEATVVLPGNNTEIINGRFIDKNDGNGLSVNIVTFTVD